MTEILSIDDLSNLSARSLEEAKVAVSIKDRLLRYIRKGAAKTGLTLEEYTAQIEALPAFVDCRHCGGTGQVIPEKPRGIGWIHPSSAHKCVLRLYYDVTTEIVPVDTIEWESVITFAMGHTIHEIVQRCLADLVRPEDDEAIDIEAPIYLTDLVKGHADGLMRLTAGGVIARSVLEIKTIGSEYDTLKAPKPEHLTQAMGLYATALDAPFVTYLYISKKWPHDVKEFVLPYDANVFHTWVRNKGSKVHEALMTGQPPIADADPTECAKCPYGHACPAKVVKGRGGQLTRTNGR